MLVEFWPISPLSVSVVLVAFVCSISKTISDGAPVGDDVFGCNVVTTVDGNGDGDCVGNCVGNCDGARVVGMPLVAVSEGGDDEINVGD